MTIYGYPARDLRRAFIPRIQQPHAPQPMIEVATVTDEEIARRVAGGEEGIDVAIEHTSWIWFFDRDGYRRASGLARMIARGLKVAGVRPGDVQVAGPCERGARNDVVLLLSAHHVAGVA